MMKKTLAPLLVFALTALWAAEAAPLARGTAKVNATSTFELNTDNGTRFGLELAYGKFIEDYIETGVYAGYAEDDAISDMYAGVFAEYNFETGSEFIPFAGAQISIHSVDIEIPATDENTTAAVFGFYTGAKFFMSETTAIQGRLLLETATDDIYIDEDETTDANLTFSLGLGFYF